MALLDGAVQGMVGRLVRVGYLPEEAFCIAQAAYLKPHKFAPGTPQPVLTKRRDVSWEVSQTLSLLARYPMGVEAHRQRIILWGKIFGRGSWHEPIDPAETHPEQAHRQPGELQPSQAVNAAASYVEEEPNQAPPPLIFRDYDKYLPGDVGDYSESHGQELLENCPGWLVAHASRDGFTIRRESIHAELLNIDLLRGAGHNLEQTGLQDHMGLAVHLKARGFKLP